jgi:hypothetical protein
MQFNNYTWKFIFPTEIKKTQYFFKISVQDSSSSQGDALSPTTPIVPTPSSATTATSGGGHRHRTSSSSSASRPSLAEDIHAIRLSLEGASSNAREKILKILERLTARLAVAEAERDGALSKFYFSIKIRPWRLECLSSSSVEMWLRPGKIRIWHLFVKLNQILQFLVW